MKKYDISQYISAALAALAVITAGILVFFFFNSLPIIKKGIVRLVEILMPFIVGAVIAYLLAPIYNVLCRNLLDFFRQKTKMEEPKNLASGLSVFLCIALGIGIIVGLIAMVLPQLVTSVIGVINSMPAYMDQISVWLGDLFQRFNIYGGVDAQAAFDSFANDLETWLTGELLPGLQNISKQLGEGMNSIMTGVFNGVVVAFQALKNLILGFIVAVYVLAGKERLTAKSKRIVYSLLGVKKGNDLMNRLRYTHKVFGGFIVGKLLDSLIMGLLCFIGASMLDLPYSLLISAIVGVTNIIPFFGPFLGAIPCALLILLVSPIKCLYFIIFVLALQQFDGNILGPKILGNATGLTAFGVLFSIVFFGGLFGFVGMVIGVPLFAVIASMLNEFVTHRLAKNGMKTDLDHYILLDHVTEDKSEYVPHKDPTEK